MNENSRRSSAPLVALVIVVGLSGAAALAYWQHRHRQEVRSRNERSASHWIKALASVEADYRANDRDGNGVNDVWTGDIAGLYRYGLIDRELAEADANPINPLVPTPIPKDGHLYRALVLDETDPTPEPYAQDTDGKSGKVHHRTKFGFCVYPADMGATGRYIWIVNENNTTLRSNSHVTTPLPPLNWPPDPKIREWSKVQ